MIDDRLYLFIYLSVTEFQILAYFFLFFILVLFDDFFRLQFSPVCATLGLISLPSHYRSTSRYAARYDRTLGIRSQVQQAPIQGGY